MDDCFSLPNAAELVELLRHEEYFWREDDYHIKNPHADIAKAAADAIEQLLAENAKLKEIADSTYNGAKTRIAKLEEMNNGLLADRETFRTENAKLKAERDAAVADIRHVCYYCKHEDCSPKKEPCFSCKKRHYDGSHEFAKWEWRGVKEKEDD